MIWVAVVVEQSPISTESNVAIYVAAISGVVAVVVAWIARGRFKVMQDSNALDHGQVVEQVLALHQDFRTMASALMVHIEKEDEHERLVQIEVDEVHSIKAALGEHVEAFGEHLAGMEERRLVAIKDVEAVIDRALQPWRDLAVEQGWDGVERRITPTSS